MSDDRFDAIIVGGGMAGLSAAIVMANAGLEVMLCERGDSCGSKNMTGGRLYGHSLEKVIPGFAKEAPIERRVTKEIISIMNDESSFNLDFASKKLSNTAENASYTVLRGKFDRWMGEKAEEAGVALLSQILVDKILMEGDKVVGIDAGGEEIYGDVVILADGVNSLLAQLIGMKKELQPHEVAVGVKEVIRLDEATINQRFGLRDDEGAAWLSMGQPTAGSFGGGLIYTNKDSLSVGIVATIEDIGYTEPIGLSVPQMLDRFKEHPSVAPYIEGGEVIEYTAHLVPEGGIHMIPELYRDGVLVVGDAAGFCVNMGFTVRGMDFAIESGRLAAETVIHAKTVGDFSADTLKMYRTLLNQSFVIKDMQSLKGFPTLLSRREIFRDVPDMTDDIATKLFTVDGKPSMDFLMYVINSFTSHTTVAQLSEFASTILNAF